MHTERQLLEEYTPLVRKIANGFVRRLPCNVLREDLIAAGMCGLWDAINRKTADENFEWYARVRIRGAIIDELRAQDWLPRRARTKEGSVITAVIREDDLTDMEQRSMVLQDTLADSLLDARREHDKLMSYVDMLPTRERHIVLEHYFNEVKFVDLAHELGISPPRVSQLHAQALNRLQDYAKEYADGTTAGDPPKSARRLRVRVPR